MHQSNAGMKRPLEAGENPAAKRRRKVEWAVCVLCGSTEHEMANCTVAAEKNWTLNNLPDGWKKSSLMANGSSRDLILLFDFRDMVDQRLNTHFLCCCFDLQIAMFETAIQTASKIRQHVPQMNWVDLSFNFGSWLSNPKKSTPHIHLSFTMKDFEAFLKKQAEHSPVWPQNARNFTELMSLPYDKNYDNDLMFVSRPQPPTEAAKNMFTLSKPLMEEFFRAGLCDGALGMRLTGPQMQIFVRVGEEQFGQLSEEIQAKTKGMSGFKCITGKSWRQQLNVYVGNFNE